MRQVLWDASALTKRYAPEEGSNTADALFALTPATRMGITYLGYAEAAASLRRKFNQRLLTATQCDAARRLLRREVLGNPEFELLTIDDTAILAGIALVDQYNLNATDAAVLVTCLRYAHGRSAGDLPCILVASDQRLLRAALAEGMAALDPETVPAADVPDLLLSG